VKKYIIYFILFLACILRLYHIDFPVAGWHSWRQADTAAMARNFYENNFNLFYPQIDWGGNTSGVVESEFPIYSFAVAALYQIFGFNDMWGRLLSVLFSLFTIYGLYLLIKKYISETVALWSAFIYAVIPLNIYYGRAFMPESAMLMCSVWGIYHFSLWLESSAKKYFVLSAVFITLAVLLKIPTLYIGLPLLYLAWLRFGSKTLKTGSLWLFAIMVLVPVAAWYYHAHQIYFQSGLTFVIWDFGTDKWGNFDLIITPSFYNDILFKSIAERHLTYPWVCAFHSRAFHQKEKAGRKTLRLLACSSCYLFSDCCKREPGS
jgi:4-amino-4-deoxy-L-arabinose transferase-like glycosyltransferase